MVANAYKRINANARKDTWDDIVKYVSYLIIQMGNSNPNYSLHMLPTLFDVFNLAKCIIPCMNDGKCININKCRCPHGFGGDHCEIDNRQQTSWKCKRPCRNGTCMANHQCRCNKGWSGRFCNKRGNFRLFSKMITDNGRVF